MRQRALRGATAILATLLSLVPVLGPPFAPAGAATDPEVAELSDDLASVRRELEAANARIMGNREDQAVLGANIRDLLGQIETFRTHIAETESQIDALRVRRDAVLKVVRTRAALLYTRREPGVPIDGFFAVSAMTTARRQVLAAAIARRDEATRTELRIASDKLAVARDELAAQRDDLEAKETDLQARQRTLADLGAQIQAEQARLDRQARDVQGRLQAAIAAGVVRAGGPSLLGPTALSAAQMAAWWRAQRYPAPSVSISIDALAEIYVREGSAEGVRGDLAFAQAVLETGGFRYTAPGNNFAGMGWCDSCATGRVFPTPTDGVRAQIQHLKNYGDPTSRAAGLSHPASVYWYAPSSRDQGVADTNFNTFFAKGWALTWNQMGNGNWATDPGYSAKVLNLYASMVAFAQTA